MNCDEPNSFTQEIVNGLSRGRSVCRKSISKLSFNCLLPSAIFR